MPSITLGIIDHLVFVTLVAFVPWNAGRRFRSLGKAVDARDPNARKRAYRTILIGKWVWVAVIAVAWIAQNRSAESIGLNAEFTEFTPLRIGGFALTALAIGGLLMFAKSVGRSEQMRTKTRQSIASAQALLPHTATEKRWFDSVSVTASISEELIYRGFLFAYLISLIPGLPTSLVILVAALVFGLTHSYQGPAGIVKTGMLGILFGVLYWMTGSLLAPVLLHAAVDLTSGWVSWQVIREGHTTKTVTTATA